MRGDISVKGKANVYNFSMFRKVKSKNSWVMKRFFFQNTWNLGLADNIQVSPTSVHWVMHSLSQSQQGIL